MYSEENRMQLLNQITAIIKNNPIFDGMIQIGSGAVGFADIYSDIDLMIGCSDTHALETAQKILLCFFKENGAIYINNRRWTKTVLGISAFYDNGLSVDISFMPTQEMPIKSRSWRLLYASNKDFEATLAAQTMRLAENDSTIVNDEFHHKFFYALRQAQIATLRGNYFYADIALCEARQMLLLIEAIAEGKKVHQFKAYNTLNKNFLDLIELTYPKERSSTELQKAIECLLQTYKNTVANYKFCRIDDAQPRIVNCFRR